MKPYSKNRWISLAIASVFAAAVFLTTLPIQAQETKGHQPGGTIKGVVNTPWVKRYPALVYLDNVKGEFPPQKKNPFMGQKGLVFAPHILPVLKGSTVDFTNDDSVAHNVFTPPGAATRFNLGLYGVGVKKEVTFNNLGEVPLLCNVHPEMLGYVIVLQNPYFALTRQFRKIRDPERSFGNLQTQGLAREASRDREGCGRGRGEDSHRRF